jgi:hypothetical protein
MIAFQTDLSAIAALRDSLVRPHFPRKHPEQNASREARNRKPEGAIAAAT